MTGAGVRAHRARRRFVMHVDRLAPFVLWDELREGGGGGGARCAGGCGR